jgi:hypothetical protein
MAGFFSKISDFLCSAKKKSKLYFSKIQKGLGYERFESIKNGQKR